MTVLAWDLSASRRPQDEYRILGAVSIVLGSFKCCLPINLFQKPLDYQDFEILDSFQAPKRRPSFWANTVRARVEGQVKIVKLFHSKSGGRDAFEKSLLQLGRHPFVT